ncbi:MAG: hypothetical protein QW579_00615, partial [Desulfurococcaceae archaeon]
LLALIAGILILTRRNYRKYVKHIVTLLVIQLICLFVISVSVRDMWVFVGTASLVFLVLAINIADNPRYEFIEGSGFLISMLELLMGMRIIVVLFPIPHAIYTGASYPSINLL